MANLTKLRDLAYKYQHAINYRERSIYWNGLIRVRLCDAASVDISTFIKKMGYSSDFSDSKSLECPRELPVVDRVTKAPLGKNIHPNPIYVRGVTVIGDVAKEVLQPRLDLLEQFIIELEIQNETLQELSERRD